MYKGRRLEGLDERCHFKRWTNVQGINHTNYHYSVYIYIAHMLRPRIITSRSYNLDTKEKGEMYVVNKLK